MWEIFNEKLSHEIIRPLQYHNSKNISRMGFIERWSSIYTARPRNHMLYDDEAYKWLFLFGAIIIAVFVAQVRKRVGKKIINEIAFKMLEAHCVCHQERVFECERGELKVNNRCASRARPHDYMYETWASTPLKFLRDDNDKKRRVKVANKYTKCNSGRGTIIKLNFSALYSIDNVTADRF